MNAKDDPLEARLRAAAVAVLARQERKEHPRGSWQDGLWWPKPEERRVCCETIQPSPDNKQALEGHCRSQTHVAQLFGVPALALRRAAAAARRERARAAGSPTAIESPRAEIQVVLQDATAALHQELGQLALWLAPEPGAEAETLANLLPAIERAEKRLVLVRCLIEMCREAQGAAAD